MKLSPVRVFLVILFVFIGCFGIAFAAAGMLTALPPPAVGGTCGPSTGSETALQALAQPGSIGAGPEPPTSNITAHRQWETFIDQCQTMATRRGLASMAVAVISIVVAGVGLVWVLKRRPSDEDSRDGEDAGSVDSSTTWADGRTTDGAGELIGAGVAPAGQWGAGPLQAYPPSPYPFPYPGQPYGGQPPGYPQPGYPPQGWPQQAYPQQGYPQPPTYPQQGYPQQGWVEHPPPAPQSTGQPDMPAEGALGATTEPYAPSPPSTPWPSAVLDDAPVEPDSDTTPGSTGA